MILVVAVAWAAAGCRIDLGQEADGGGDADADADAGINGNADGGGSGGGEDGGALSCAFAACGGDLRGAWSMQRACLTVPLDQIVPTVLCGRVAVTDVRLAGENSTVFQAGGAYSVVSATQATTVVSLPASCVGTRASCAAVAAELGLEFPNDSVSCAGTPAAGGCTCDVTGPPTSSSVTGEFTTVGNELIATPAAGSALTYEYCVQDRALRIRSRDAFRTITVYTR